MYNIQENETEYIFQHVQWSQFCCEGHSITDLQHVAPHSPL